MDSSPAAATHVKLRSVAEFQLHELNSPGGVCAQVLPGGALFAFRHGEILINQLLPGPAEDGLFRLLLREHDDGGIARWAPLAGPGLDFAADPRAATWCTKVSGAGELVCTTTLALHPVASAWAWRIHVRNAGPQTRRIDVLLAQDLGLAVEGAVRNNEAYVSQYLDLLPLCDETLGHVILARQNQPTKDGQHPWLALACAEGAAAFCTDGWQFFGTDHRRTGEPAAVRSALLPSRRLQYEFALGGLQSRVLAIAPGASSTITFLNFYQDDHPAASGPADLMRLHELLPITWMPPALDVPAVTPAASVFTSAAWLHGARPTAAEWDDWFPGSRRHVELDSAGRLLSFFHAAQTHVVSCDKETAIARPHGHILCNGGMRWIDEHQFGLTCYASGIFGAQAYLGNPNLARLLSVVRNQLNVARASGQRVFIRTDDGWSQLGVPSAWAVEPGQVRWIYRLPDGVVEARVWCSSSTPVSFLELRVTAGPPREFLITHQLALGANEFDTAGELEIHEDGWITCHPAPDGFMAEHLPGTHFALAAADASSIVAHGGDELLYADGTARQGPYAVFATPAVSACTMIMLGVVDGLAALPGAVAAARAEFVAGAEPARPPAAPLRVSGSGDAGVARLDEVLPWFTHNAGIHFAAPHGLEQYGGAAWGVRDVCQGSLEWLLAAGDLAAVRRMLTTVFAQQYAPEGNWPQWFMHAPFRFLQQVHSHGDVCFWPVKALCDYVEASNDLAFMEGTVGYTDAELFTAVGPAESLWVHCDRVVTHAESRFVPGTALVNYGDGDWDDTLQPADPAMRTRMISAWTVALAFQTFRQLAAVCVRAGEPARAARLEALLARMQHDFRAHLMPDGIVAGFLVAETDGARPLLHPRDRVTGIRYRLLPMTRAVLAELFTPDEARRHLALVETELRYPDGVRLMSEPAVYQGGLEKLFKRADTAANVGREIGLHYVHAHLRYAEAMAKVGDADALWQALQVVNPVGLHEVLPQAAPRQSNVYFSSSDADFDNRYEAAARWAELRDGRVAVRGGWRLYSSGPGLFLHKVRACLLGLRESFGDVVFDPVLPRNLDGLVATVELCGRPVRISYRVREATHTPSAITVDGARIEGGRDPNPYRTGGWRVPTAQLAGMLAGADNHIEIEL